MPTRTRNILRMSWRQVRNPSIVGLPKFLNPADLTRSSWAKPIKSYADVPDVYKEFFDSFPVDGQAFPYTVLTPSYERFIHKTTEKLISDFGRDIYVLERDGKTFEMQCYPIDGISYVEMRTALLASSFTICGMTGQEEYASSTLKFNSVTDYLFTPILKRVRRVPLDSEDIAQSAEIEKFNSLADVNFKFMNLAKHSLLEGEKVAQFIIQPEIQESLLTFLGRTYFKTISPTHMSILTDRELIVIREDATRRKEDRYGGFWDYIPLNKIESLSMSEDDENLLVLTIQLPENTSFEFLYQASALAEISLLLERFRELTAE
jgi:hypothetical protein